MNNVVVVSSNPLLLRRFRFALELIDVETQAVADFNSALALDYAKTGVVFCGCTIIDGNPFELVRQIRARSNNPDGIRFVCMTLDCNFPLLIEQEPYNLFDCYFLLPFVRRRLYRVLLDLHFIRHMDLNENLLCNNIPEAVVIELLQKKFKNHDELQPSFNPLLHLGYNYPDADAILPGDYRDSINILFQLHQKGLLDRRLMERIHLCPKCGYFTVNFREACPACHSIDFKSTDILHHFSCGYVGEFNEFYRSGSCELICPKCDKLLRHIGLDYEKPAHVLKCNSCGADFSEPAVRCSCIHCQKEFGPDEAVDHNIYVYSASEAGRTVLAQKIPSLGKINRNEPFPFSVGMEAFGMILRQNYLMSSELQDHIQVLIFSISPASESMVAKLLAMIHEINTYPMVLAVGDGGDIFAQAFHLSDEKRSRIVTQLQESFKNDPDLKNARIRCYVRRIEPDSLENGNMILQRIEEDFQRESAHFKEGVVYHESHI